MTTRCNIEAEIFYGIEEKAKRTLRRKKIIHKAKLAPRFKQLEQSDCVDLMAALKQLRWRLHNATTSYNLSVAQRRRHNQPDKFIKFSGQNTNNLTLSRLCLRAYSRNTEIFSGVIVDQAAEYNIVRTTVFDFFSDAVSVGLLKKTQRGAYAFTEEALDSQFDNLISLLLDENTWNLYRTLELAYGAMSLAAASVKTDFRDEGKSRMSKLIDLHTKRKNKHESPEPGQS